MNITPGLALHDHIPSLINAIIEFHPFIAKSEAMKHKVKLI